MYICRLFIKNYRNLRHLDLEIGPGVTCFIGENNAGKTNIFQAVRLLLDGNLSAQRRRLQADDLSTGLSFAQPQQVIIAIEFDDFQGRANEEALPYSAVLPNGRARLTYRFRPKALIRTEIEENENTELRRLGMDDYIWEIAAGGSDIALDDLTYLDNFGTRFGTDQLQQGYLVVLMEALRDVESRLASPRSSPLQQIIQQRRIPEAEQESLIGHLQTANANINASATIGNIGTSLTDAFGDTIGSTFAMGVTLGLGEPSFTDISQGLRVLLSGFGMTDLDPGRNGLGMNNILFISMLQHYFHRRVAEQLTAGQLLLVEEPEAHLHPQLQRILLTTLQQREVQVFITTHSTHITSGIPLGAQVVLTSTGGSFTSSVKLSTIPGLQPEESEDLERYLDATRSALLYARKVLLVEGPAEQFLIAPLVKQVLGVDLDKEGITVVPIFGTHFKSYARLFGPLGINKKCAVLTDGDLVPSDAVPDPDEDGLDGTASPTRQDLLAVENGYVKVFSCETTFERELTLPGTLRMLEGGTRAFGAVRTANQLRALALEHEAGRAVNLATARASVLKTAKRFGKARFAQTISKHVLLAEAVPNYLADAINWLRDDETNN